MRLRLQHLGSWVASGRPPSVAQTKIALQSVCYLHRGPAPFTGHVLQWIKSTRYCRKQHLHILVIFQSCLVWISFAFFGYSKDFPSEWFPSAQPG